MESKFPKKRKLDKTETKALTCPYAKTKDCKKCQEYCRFAGVEFGIRKTEEKDGG